MADADEKARQEKIAAARKRVEQMKKKKGKKGATVKKEQDDNIEATSPNEEEPAQAGASEAGAAEGETETASGVVADNEKPAEDERTDDSSPSETPSLAHQSKLRSTSFRAGNAGPASPGPLSSDGDTAPEIYRKQASRIEELERENKKLLRDSLDSEKRWKKAEDELAVLREADGESSSKTSADSEVDKLKSEIASLQRQNAQLQQQVSRGLGHGHRSSISVAALPSDLQADLDAKTSTIESMEIEISTLKARLHRQETGAQTEKEQVVALEEKLAGAEAAAGRAQRELQDEKSNLERTNEKLAREASERSSAETKVKKLERDLYEATKAKFDLEAKADDLEKTIAKLRAIQKDDVSLQSTRMQQEREERERRQSVQEKRERRQREREAQLEKMKQRSENWGKHLDMVEDRNCHGGGVGDMFHV